MGSRILLESRRTRFCSVPKLRARSCTRNLISTVALPARASRRSRNKRDDDAGFAIGLRFRRKSRLNRSGKFNRDGFQPARSNYRLRENAIDCVTRADPVDTAGRACANVRRVTQNIPYRHYGHNFTEDRRFIGFIGIIAEQTVTIVMKYNRTHRLVKFHYFSINAEFISNS